MAERGKYDDESERIQIKYRASGAIVIVLGGNIGTGFSVTAAPDVIADLPAVLRSVADSIEEQSK